MPRPPLEWVQFKANGERLSQPPVKFGSVHRFEFGSGTHLHTSDALVDVLVDLTALHDGRGQWWVNCLQQTVECACLHHRDGPLLDVVVPLVVADCLDCEAHLVSLFFVGDEGPVEMEALTLDLYPARVWSRTSTLDEFVHVSTVNAMRCENVSRLLDDARLVLDGPCSNCGSHLVCGKGVLL